MIDPVVIGLDASWRNTGVAVLVGDRILHLETIKTYKKAPHANDIMVNSNKIRRALLGIFSNHKPGLVAYEIPDYNRSYHQGYSNNFGPQANLKREGQARESLARTEVIIAQLCYDYDIKLVSMGANHVKMEFGAKSKQGIADIVAAQFSNQLTNGVDGGIYFDQKKISDHESDAIAIAFVAACENRRDEMARMQ